MYTWGEGKLGVLGTGSFEDCLRPTQITKIISHQHKAEHRMKFISAGISHAAAISEDGVLFTWGQGFKG